MMALARLFEYLLVKLTTPAQNDRLILRMLKLLLAAVVLCVAFAIAFLRIYHQLGLGPN